MRLQPNRLAGPNLALASLIVGGSDARLRVNRANHLNGYGCQPWPRPDEISLSSSTASTISERGHVAAEAAHRQLGSGKAGLERTFERLTEELREDLRALLELPADTGIVLAPSGTDAELQALFVSRCLLGAPTVSVIAAADETGSGVALAASGRHFDAVTAGGRQVTKGGPIAGLAAEAACISVAARDRNGRLRPLGEVDAEIGRQVTTAVAAGFGAIVHVMHHSKTGACGPSDACIEALRADHGPRVQIVIDACQVRIAPARLRHYLDLGCLVLITGSKFFTGPPLSGALLTPAGLSARMADVVDVPAGLAEYSARTDWPAHWTGVRAALPAWMNIGQLLRWTAAVAEMRAYKSVPQLFRTIALRELGAAFARAIGRHPSFQCLAGPQQSGGSRGQDEFDAPTVFPFLLRRDGRLLTMNESRLLYRALNDDVSFLFPSRYADLASRLCHIGQPVAVPDGCGGIAGALRLSADARMVSECWSGRDDGSAMERLHASFGLIQTVLNKLSLLVDHFDKVEAALGANP